MRMTIKCVSSFFAAVALLATACQKDELTSQHVQTSNRKIEVKACVTSEGAQNVTRSAIVGTAVPTDRNLVISAYFNNPSDGERGVTSDGSCDYFKDVKFAFNGQVWIPEDNSIYWPLTGSLDFLAYSAEQDGISASWGEGYGSSDALNCSEKVVLGGFNAEQSALDDVLYGVATKQSLTSTAVPIEFRHAKALIVFTAKANYDDAITITDIKMENISSVDGGLILEVENNVSGISATWKRPSAVAPVAMDVSVPGINSYPVPIKTMDVTKKAFYCGIGGKGFMVYGGHRMTSFTVTFTQTTPNGQLLTKKFTYDCSIGIQDGDPQPVWQAGKRYVYELDFDLQEISVNSQVNDWSIVN